MEFMTILVILLILIGLYLCYYITGVAILLKQCVNRLDWIRASIQGFLDGTRIEGGDIDDSRKG